jgi:hypothetical protein
MTRINTVAYQHFLLYLFIKKMKILLFSILLVGMISCETKVNGISKTNSKQYWSTRLDTFYKENSTKIESVRRTIFATGDYLAKHRVSLTKDIGESYYALHITDDLQSGVEIFQKKEIDKFFKDADTVLANTDKPLRYTFGRRGSLSKGISGGIQFYSYDILSGKIVGGDLSKEAYDSLKASFTRFLSEPK